MSAFHVGQELIALCSDNETGWRYVDKWFPCIVLEIEEGRYYVHLTNWDRQDEGSYDWFPEDHLRDVKAYNKGHDLAVGDLVIALVPGDHEIDCLEWVWATATVAKKAQYAPRPLKEWVVKYQIYDRESHDYPTRRRRVRYKEIMKL